MFKTAGIEFIRNEMDWDKYDPYASNMSALFDLCEAWWAATGEHINQYEPSAFLVQAAKDGVLGSEMEERSARIAHAVWESIVVRDDVMYWSKVLLRMDGLIEKAGRDY